MTKKKKKQIWIIVIVIIAILGIVSIFSDDDTTTQQPTSQTIKPTLTESLLHTGTVNPTETDTEKPTQTESAKQTQNTGSTPTPSATISQETVTGDILKVHYIDVGQGDSILIQQGDYNMLIDAGENDKGTVVTRYLNSLGVDTLDYVIGTHPHSDHIGGLDTVINRVETKKAIIPDVEHTTKTYEDFIDALLDNDVETYPAAAGDKYSLGKATFTLLAPNSDYYKSMNNYSVVIKLTFGSKSFLFCGDAEKQSENEMLAKKTDIKADVIKMGHHGSSTSSTDSFIKAVGAKYAVICCGKDNSYGHPHREVKSIISKYGMQSYQTDTNGTIVATCDGKNITFKTQK